MTHAEANPEDRESLSPDDYKGPGRPAYVLWVELAQEMKKRGISREELADSCGVTVQAVGYWLGGSKRPDLRHWPVITAKTGISTEDLLEQSLRYFPKNNN